MRTSQADIALSQRLEGADPAVLCEVGAKLPDKLSDLLEMAVADAQAVEATPGYSLDMYEWVAFKPETCTACMAGAVMLRHIGAMQRYEDQIRLTPGDVTADIDEHRKLLWINHLRQGVADFTHPRDAILEDLLKPIRHQFDYALLRAPWETYLRVAKDLRAAGY